MSNLEELSDRFAQQPNHFAFLSATYEGFHFSTVSPVLLIVSLLIIVILMSVKWNLTVVLVCISLMANDAEHLFMCLLAVCVSSSEAFQALCSVFNQVGFVVVVIVIVVVVEL